MKYIYLLFALLVLLPLVSATDTIYIQQTHQYDLKVPCFNNGSYCSSTAVCNITISNQQTGSIVIQNTKMTNQVQFHNVTLLPIRTGTVGQYTATVTCQDSGYNGFSTFPVFISPSGSDDNNISQIVLLSFAIVIGIGMMIVGFTLKEGWWVVASGMIFLSLGLYTLLNGVGLYRNTLTEAVSLIVTLFGGYLMLRSAWEMIGSG